MTIHIKDLFDWVLMGTHFHTSLVKLISIADFGYSSVHLFEGTFCRSAPCISLSMFLKSSNSGKVVAHFLRLETVRLGRKEFLVSEK